MHSIGKTDAWVGTGKWTSSKFPGHPMFLRSKPRNGKFHFAQFTLSCPRNTSVFLPRPLPPLHSPVLARPRPFLARSSPGLARPPFCRPSPGPLPALSRPSPGLVSSNLTVKTGKRDIHYPRKQTFEGGRELFDHHPLEWKTPTPPGRLRIQNVDLCALLSCLIEAELLKKQHQKKSSKVSCESVQGHLIFKDSPFKCATSKASWILMLMVWSAGGAGWDSLNWQAWPAPDSCKLPTSLKVSLPPIKNYYVNNSLRVIFVILKGFYKPDILRREGIFSSNYAWI